MCRVCVVVSLVCVCIMSGPAVVAHSLLEFYNAPVCPLTDSPVAYPSPLCPLSFSF